MQKINIPQAESQSADLIQENIEQLKQIFPEIIKEGRIDIEALNDLLGNYIDTPEERFYLNWAGKANARREAQKRSTGTLRPCPEESVNWDTTENLYIEGDNLEVLKLLQKSYHSRVKMIYIDPPYNTGKDFVYKDDYSDNMKNYLELTGQDKKLSTNTESDGRYHSNWLNMMYPRLKLARNLLTDDGVIFISIDDNEVANLRKVCDEIFGEENSLLQLIWELPRGINAGFISKSHEYILGYCKDIRSLKLFFKETTDKSIERCNKKIDSRHPESSILFPAGIEYEGEDKVITGVINGSERLKIDGKMIFKNGKLIKPVTVYAGWTMKNMILDWLDGKEVIDLKGQRINRFFFKENGRLYSEKIIKFDSPKSILKSLGDSQSARKQLFSLFGSEDIFDYPKPTVLIKKISSFITSHDDLILDFFSGSATTAHAVMQLNAEDGGNRKYICVQLPEPTPEDSEARKAGYNTIPEIAKERIRRAGKKLLEEKKVKAEKEGGLFVNDSTKLDIGFKVFKLDSSNINAWDSNPDNLETALYDSLFNIKENRSEDDLLYEILIKYGIELTEKINRVAIDDKTVYEMGAGSLIVCLADDLTTEVAEGIGKLYNKVKPEGVEGNCRVVFKDSGFNGSDEVKTNTLLILKQHGITNVASV